MTYKRALPDPLRYGLRLRSEDRNDEVCVFCDAGWIREWRRVGAAR